MCQHCHPLLLPQLASGFTQDALQRCVQNCQTPLQNTQNAINQEVQQFQARIQRCAAACQDDARDLMPADGNMTQALQEKAQAQMDGCVTRCVDKHIALLPGLKERLDTFCARVKDQQPQAQE